MYLIARQTGKWALGLGLVAAATFLCASLLRTTPLTAALAYLLLILAASTRLGLALAMGMSLAAVLGLNYYFLPPLYSFTFDDGRDWMSLVAFLVVGMVGSNLAARAQREARAAERRQREAERLYRYSQLLLQEGDVLQLCDAIPRHLAAAFAARASALYLSATDGVYRSGAPAGLAESGLRSAVEGPPARGAGECMGAVRLGARRLGSFGLAGTELTPATLAAVGSLTGSALERARALEHLARSEAARESEYLKTALLDAVTLEFRAPLAGMRQSVAALLAGAAPDQLQASQRLRQLSQECDRMQGLVEEATEMARLDAGRLELRLRPLPVRDLVATAVRECGPELAARPLVLELPADLPPVRADLASAKRVLVQLLENAGQYSPAGAPIGISATRQGRYVRISVADRGPGVELRERELIFERFYRGRALQQRHPGGGGGMGLPIARAIARAHGGTVALAAADRSGSTFTFILPAAAA